MIAASVIDETRMKYSLDSISKDYLNETKYKYDLAEKVLEWSNGMIKDPMSNMHKLPHHLVKDYAEQDVNLTLKLWSLFEKKLDTTATFKSSVKEAVEYVKNHFNTEEKYMIQIKYPGLEDQRKMHKKFVIQLLSNVKSYESNDILAPRQFLKFLRFSVLIKI